MLDDLQQLSRLKHLAPCDYRQASPLKSLFNYMFNEGMVSFAGGELHWACSRW